ncbi:hypothetical protein M407DRAFT_26113 [Tulasnella calospora MUT 4182]|uniref:Uncharacterized protein n=1 Tax=Tulasnella calospora MUT 4182 TaxID=1051891 RepID=A0A0C3Q5R3_9AGAM|nr:hypothetical protein M407DRAFT_26113 [Tulasnella calospora MUT 4182]
MSTLASALSQSPPPYCGLGLISTSRFPSLHYISNAPVTRYWIFKSTSGIEVSTTTRHRGGSVPSCPWLRTRPRRFLKPLDFPVVFPTHLQELSRQARRSRDWVTAFPEPLAGLKSLCLANTKLFISNLLIVLVKLTNLKTLVIQDCTTEQEPSRGTVHRDPPKPHDASIRYTQRQIHFLHPASPSQSQNHFLKKFGMIMISGTGSAGHGLLGRYSARARNLRVRISVTNNNLKALLDLAVGEGFEQDFLPHLEHLVLDNVFQLMTKDFRQIITHRPGLRFLELRGRDGSNVADNDVQFIRQSVERFILETFYKESGGLEEKEEDEDNEEGSSFGTPSEGSWLSGDEDICLR